MATGSTTIISNVGLMYGPLLAPRSFGTNLEVTPLTPKVEGDHRVYRERVTSQITLSGKVPYKGVVLAPALPNEAQLVLRCRVECRSCASTTSTASSRHCRPAAFDLDPVPDPKSDRPFELKLQLDESNGILIADATFHIRHRPRTPKSEDQEWRCCSESLM